MSYEKDPHVRERELCYHYGGLRIPLKDRPSKWSRVVNHPWLDVSLIDNRQAFNYVKRFLLDPYSRIKRESHLHIASLGFHGLDMKHRIILLRDADFLRWFGGDCDWRAYRDRLEREERERIEAANPYPQDHESELHGWSFKTF